MKKLYKYSVTHVSLAGAISVNYFHRLKDAKEYVEAVGQGDNWYFIVPCHGPNYCIRFVGRVFTKYLPSAY